MNEVVKVNPGEVFGQWTVVEEQRSLKGKRVVLCRCSCGRTKSVDLYSLRRGHSLKCKVCSLQKVRKHVEIPVGSRYGLWVVLGEAGVRASGSRYILCRCKCGLEKPVNYSSLQNGTTSGCKSCIHETTETLKAGDVVNSWTLLSRVPGRRRGNVYFLCRCTCGKEREVDYSSLQRKKAGGCASCSQRLKTKDGNFGSLGTIWGRIRASAEVRGIEFLISQDYAAGLFVDQEGLCALTGLPLLLRQSQGKEGTASLDRIDSKQGYVEGNVQWVHKDINRMKNVFSQDYFIQTCKLVVAYDDSKRQVL